jgi:hypothetical protein
VKVSTTVSPPGARKNDVGMYWNEKREASCCPAASPVIAFTKMTLPSYAGTTSSATAEISRHDCQLSEWNST